VGRVANLNFGAGIGDDCVWRWNEVLCFSGEIGELGARVGEDDSGEDIEGRCESHLKMGAGANESMASVLDLSTEMFSLFD